MCLEVGVEEVEAARRCGACSKALTALLRDLDKRLEKTYDERICKGHEACELRRPPPKARCWQRHAAAGLMQRDHDG